jgi:hypothetical protein
MFFVHSAAQRKDRLPLCRPSAEIRICVRVGFLIYPNVRLFMCPVSGMTLFPEVGIRKLLVEPSKTTSDQGETDLCSVSIELGLTMRAFADEERRWLMTGRISRCSSARPKSSRSRRLPVAMGFNVACLMNIVMDSKAPLAPARARAEGLAS